VVSSESVPSSGPATGSTGAPGVDTILELTAVSKFFGPVKAVDRVSIDVRKGEVLTLLGPSGCGKTTTLRMVIGLERCDEGEIVYRGEVVDSARTGVHRPTQR
jgi:iron(III) transport system ATP-binding protein